MDINKKEDLLEAIKIDPSILQYAPIYLRDDLEIVTEAVKRDANCLQFASEGMQQNKDLLLEAIKQDKFDLENVSSSLLNDKEFVLELVKTEGEYIIYASDELKNDEEIAKEAVLNNEKAFKFIGEEAKKNEKVCQCALKNDLSCENILCMDKAIRFAVILDAVRKDECFMIHFERFCDCLNDDKEFDEIKKFRIALKEALIEGSLETFKEKHKEFFNEELDLNMVLCKKDFKKIN